MPRGVNQWTETHSAECRPRCARQKPASAPDDSPPRPSPAGFLFLPELANARQRSPACTCGSANQDGPTTMRRSAGASKIFSHLARQRHTMHGNRLARQPIAWHTLSSIFFLDWGGGGHAIQCIRQFVRGIREGGWSHAVWGPGLENLLCISGHPIGCSVGRARRGRRSHHPACARHFSARYAARTQTGQTR